MIRIGDCDVIGKVNKAHGLDGELSISFFFENAMEAIEPGACLIFDIDGILTPFFARTVRPRGVEALLVALDGVDSQEQAQVFVGKSVYAISGQCEEEDEEEDGLYAGQLIGYEAIDADSGQVIGKIEDIDDATDNVLFIVERPQGGECRIPVVDDFIVEISREEKTIKFSLPVGLLDL